MEHRLLTDPVHLGRENLLETYLGLARAVPEATTALWENCIVATGPAELSFCNFAAGFGDTEHLEKRLEWLVETGRGNSGFWVFCLDGDQPERLDDKLMARGFGLRQSLVQMVFEGRFDPAFEGDGRVLEARDYGSRHELCLFAARTFFTRTPDRAQVRIAEATARSDHRLLGIWDAGGPVGMMMICESESAVGIYNLCVRKDKRRAGLGKVLVQYGLGWGQAKGKPVVLQCSLDLVEWYGELGFKTFGTVHAYTFAQSKWRDII